MFNSPNASVDTSNAVEALLVRHGMILTASVLNNARPSSSSCELHVRVPVVTLSASPSVFASDTTTWNCDEFFVPNKYRSNVA